MHGGRGVSLTILCDLNKSVCVERKYFIRDIVFESADSNNLHILVQVSDHCRLFLFDTRIARELSPFDLD